MREIRLPEIVAFTALAVVPVVPAVICYRALSEALPTLGPQGFISLVAAVFVFYGGLILIYRLFIRARPLPVGDIPLNSSDQFTYHVYILFFLIFFYPIMRCGIFPAPFMRAFYIALGARLGANTYTQGIIHDPVWVTIGRNSVVGESAMIIPHVIEGDKLAHFPVVVGNDVTIGAGAIVLAGSEIGDSATLAAGAVLPKGTRVGAREKWGGVPARRLAPSATPLDG